MNAKVTINDYKKSFISKRKKEQHNTKKGLHSTFIIMVSLIISLFLYYVWTLNANATAGYDIRDLEREKNQLLSEKEIIITKISQLESLDNIIKDNTSTTNMEKIDSPDYLVIKQGVQYVYNN